ncbi:ribonuclease H-like domain-containing protein [Tanacetum coccineum]
MKQITLLMELVLLKLKVPTSGDNLSDSMIYAFLASQPNSPQLEQENLEQIDPDDLEEMDLQWEMSILTIRARRFIKRTCRKLDVNGQRVGFDRGKEINRRTVTVETPIENALVAQHGIGGYDWSYQAEEEHPTNFVLMAHTSSGSYSSSDFEYQFNLVSYKASLESVEARLAHHKKNEDVYDKSINVLNLEVKLRDNALVENKKKLQKAEKERDELKLEKFQNSSKSLNNLLESQVINKFKTGLGYNAASSTAASPIVESFVNSSEMLENQENNKSKSDQGYHAVPLPFTGNFIPFKRDLMFIDEIVESENMDVITIVTASNGEKVESNHESAGVKSNGDVVEPKTVRKNSLRPPFIEDWNSNDESEVEIIPKDKTISSSTKNLKFVKSARETVEKGNPQQKEYKEKGVIDSGCSRHMTGNKCYLTEYEDYDGGFVSFRDGKGRISGKGKIKTGTLDFDNLPDESQVLLRVLRKDNIYSVDLKSVVPTKGLTCLFAKAKIDESNLWHRRLGHINFKNINKLVKGNLNGVAERRNRTLIEAARPMLVDSKLPTTFWSEAVNIACYVLNRVLVIKPHNKTPYELIRGRIPLIDFMKSFGYPVTILNTRDHLGKFDGKADEGFLLGNGPDWLFDVDSLTISMNYVPVVAGTQTIGPKDSEEDYRIKPTEADVNGDLHKDGKDYQATISEFKRLL